MIALAETGGNASVCGCSSMAEQKLPKLLTSPRFCASISKTQHETSVSIQTLRNRAQNKLRPADGNLRGATTNARSA